MNEIDTSMRQRDKSSWPSVHVTVVSGLDSTYAVAIGDLDNDGDGDVVVGQYDDVAAGSYELLWVENPHHGGGGSIAHNMVSFAASQQSPSAITISIDETSIAAEDRDHDLALAGEPGEVVSTGVIVFAGDLIFADGFESGSPDRWRRPGKVCFRRQVRRAPVRCSVRICMRRSEAMKDRSRF